MNPEELIARALQARKQAYAPYSNYLVGAAVLTKQGNIFTGCNIENASFGATVCAERMAFFSAVAGGEKEFCAIAIVGAPKAAALPFDYAPPCGICRQVFREFCEDDFQIILAKNVNDYQIYSLSELLPLGFGPFKLG